MRLMKRKILLLPILSIIIAFSGCFSNEDKIPLNNEINEKINDYVAEHSQLVLDEICLLYTSDAADE